MDIFYLTAACLAFWIVLLALNISRIRMKERVGLGHGDKLSLKKAIRAHMNTIEHAVPFSLLLFVVFDAGHPSSSFITAIIIAFGLSRLMHAYSLYASSDALRQGSAGISYACELALFGLSVSLFL